MPTAAIIESRSLSLDFGWTFNTRDTATASDAQDIATELRRLFVIWSHNLTTSTLKPFCADESCTNLEIETTVNELGDVDVKLKIEPVE